MHEHHTTRPLDYGRTLRKESIWAMMIVPLLVVVALAVLGSYAFSRLKPPPSPGVAPPTVPSPVQTIAPYGVIHHAVFPWPPRSA